jgi:hypothetical protein
MTPILRLLGIDRMIVEERIAQATAIRAEFAKAIHSILNQVHFFSVSPSRTFHSYPFLPLTGCKL